jgi:S-(hydroxymethyl)glutathione dehydrogenase / alcohol dehydrogenase
MTTRAAILEELERPLVIEDIELRAPGDHEVVVRIGAVDVCITDALSALGDVAAAPPTILGHAAAGVVEEVGAHVGRVRVGDRVVVTGTPECGECFWCVRDRPDQCAEMLGGIFPPRVVATRADGSAVHADGGVGAFAERMVVRDIGVVTVDADLSDEHLSLLGCGVTTGVGAVVNTAKVTPGANVVVFGLGGIGLNVIQGARMVGADKIIGVDINDSKEEWGRRFGMTHFVNPSKVGGDIVAHLVTLTDGGADFTFDCTGNTTVMRQALEACHRGWGVSVVIGVAESGKEIATRPFQLVTGRVWKGTAFGGARGRTDVPKIVDWYMNGKIEIDPMITHVLKLEEINKGFDLMHEGKSIRSVVVF